VAAFAAYVAAGGSVSAAARLLGIRPSTVKRHLADLRARSGLTTEQLIYAMNPLYNGWIRRHRGSNAIRRPAAWRANPPVSDELWARVEATRRSKTRGGGPRNRGRADLLAGLLECVCGRSVRSDGTFADGRHRKLHPDPCPAWGTKARLADTTWEAPVLAQLGGIELENATIAQVVAVLGSTQRPIAIDRARLERQKRELALEHVAGGMTDEAYLARLGELRTQLAAVDEGSNAGVPAELAVAWLRALGETIQHADVPEAKADLIHAIYERIIVAGPTVVSARLTPSAYAHGLALALPQVVMARADEYRTDGHRVHIGTSGEEEDR